MIITNEPITIERKMELEEMCTAVAELENQLVAYKIIKNNYEKMKENLCNAMENYGVEKLTLQNGTQLTLVKGVPPTVKQEEKFDELRFAMENEELYKNYLVMKDVAYSGRKSYVKITLPKNK